MLCPYCKKEINDHLIRSEGARLMNASRMKRQRDPETMRKIARIGGSRPKTAATRKRQRKTIEAQQAEIRRLTEELAKRDSPKRPK
jgi:hypothetical protein